MPREPGGREVTGAPIAAVLVLACTLAILVVDVAAYLGAAGRAQGAADAAALAAVTETAVAPGGAAAARRLAVANGARLESCRCPRHGPSAVVTVSVAVEGRLVGGGRVGATRVTATATATRTPG